MKRYGCIGKKLGHSFSKEIHAKLAPYSYDLIELAKEDVGAFLEKREFAAINVTIPYKTAVIPYLDSVSEIAERIGAVNTVVNREGKLYGYNTDYFGMKALVGRCGLSLLNGPGNDIVAITNLTAAGVHLILFTTGRGTPLGAPVPTVKVATNRSLAERKAG